MSGERTDRIHHRTVDTESDQKNLVGLTRLLRLRERKRRETNKNAERTNVTGGNKVETKQRVENAVVLKKARVRIVVVRGSRLVVEVVMTRRREVIAVMTATHVGMNVADLEIQLMTNRIAEDRDAAMIRAQVLTIAMIVVDAVVVRKGKMGPIVG
jgi:hypothetical protein